MTEIPAGTKVRFVRPDGVAALVKDAISRNLAGVRDLIQQVGGNVVEVGQNSDGTWPTVTRRPGVRYRWVARYNLSKLPDSTVGAQDGDEITGYASMWIGATVTPPPTDSGGGTTTPPPPPPPTDRVAVITETFTGVTDGAPWPSTRWTPGSKPAGGGATVTGGVGRLVTGTAGSWASTDAVSVRAANVVRDVEIMFDFTIVTADTKASVHLRSDSGVLDSVAGVCLDLTPTNVVLTHVTSGAWTTDVTKAKDHTRGATYRARVIVATQTGGATLIRARTWPTAATEPTTWDIDTATVPAPTTPGYYGFSVPGIGAGAGTVTFDNITVYDRPPTSGSGWGTWSG